MRTLCFTHTHTRARARARGNYCVYMHAYTNTQAYMEDNGREEA